MTPETVACLESTCDAQLTADDLPGHMVDAHRWHLCVLCGRPLQFDHCCGSCRRRLDRDLGALIELAVDAAAYVAPSSSLGPGSLGAAFGSRPPIDIEAAEPELMLVPTDVPLKDRVPILTLLEGWEQIIREQLGYADIDTAKDLRRTAEGLRRLGDGGDHPQASETAFANGTWRPADELLTDYEARRFPAPRPPATLTGVVGFLRTHLDHITTATDFGLRLFADDVHACRRALGRYGPGRGGSQGWSVECPATLDDGTCGWPLRLAGDDIDRYFLCPGCGTEWSVDRLMLVAADTPDAHLWLDAEAVTQRFGVTRKALEQWVRAGKITRAHGLYDVMPLARETRRRGA